MTRPSARRVICLVATTPFAVNAFLKSHIATFVEKFDVVLCVNTDAHVLLQGIRSVVTVEHCDINRRISILRDIRVVFQLCRIFVKYKPFIVHSITPKAGLLSMFSGWLVGVNNRIHTFTGQVWKNSYGPGRMLFKLVDKLIVFFSSNVFTDSPSQSDFLFREGVTPSRPIDVLGGASIAGVDLERFRPNSSVRHAFRQNSCISSEVIVFLFVGRITRDKGVLDLIDAFDLLFLSHSNCRLWIVGPDEDQLMGAIEEKIRFRKLPVNYFGHSSCPEKYMISADVLVLPSYREGFGSVVTEAAASGIPCISYHIDGIVDAVVDGETGILVEKADVGDLSYQMWRIATDDRLRRRLGDAAMKRAQTIFDSKLISRAWIEYYLSLKN